MQMSLVRRDLVLSKLMTKEGILFCSVPTKKHFLFQCYERIFFLHFVDGP